MMCNGRVQSTYGGQPQPCNQGTVYKCQRCGAVGCSAPGCSNQNFGGPHGTGINCMKCGDANRKPVN